MFAANRGEVNHLTLLDHLQNGLVTDAIEQVLPLRGVQDQHVAELAHLQRAVHVAVTQRGCRIQRSRDQRLVHRHAHQDTRQLRLSADTH